MIDVTWIVLSLAFYFIAIFLYHAILGLSSLFKYSLKIKSTKSQKQFRFLVLVPAHNEEEVIGDLITDLLSQDYLRDLYKVVIIADNCTDRTLEICSKFKDERLRVVERNSNQRGKGPALDFALEKIPEILPDFNPDYVVVFDADNRVPKNFLSQLSANIDEKCPAVQCKYKTLQPTSLNARLQDYLRTIYQWMCQRGKQGLGLAVNLGGTGEAIRYDLIKNLKFGTTLVEDFNLTVRLALIDKRVEYFHEIEFFDEVPDSFITEIRREVRWVAGHFQVFSRYLPKMLRKRTKTTLDICFTFFVLLGSFAGWTSYLICILNLLGIVTFSIPKALGNVLGFLFFPLFSLALFLQKKEKKFVLIYAIPLLVYGIILWLVVVPLGLAKFIARDISWYKTPHGKRR